MQFLQPGFFVLALVALLPWLGGTRLAPRWLARSGSVDARHALLRSAALLFVVIALARPVSVEHVEQMDQVLLVDRSRSLTDAQDGAVVDAVQRVLQDADTASGQWTLIEIGGEDRPAIERSGAVRSLRTTGEGEDAAALAAAARSIRPGARGRVTWITDGLGALDPEGAGTRAALDALTGSGAALDVALTPELAGDVRAIGLERPRRLRVGLEAALVAVVTGDGQVIDCALTSDGRELARAEGVQLSGATRIPLAFEPDETGFLRVTLEVEVKDGVDPRGGDLAFETTLPVEDPIEVLYLGGRVAGSDRVVAALAGRGFAIRRMTEARESALERADLVMIDDLSAAGLPEPFQAELAKRVSERGTGLIAAGGEASFGPGGYHDQPLETLLPVEFVQKEEKRDPSTTLVVIIDTSGSMGGNRVQLAKEVSRLAIRRLLPHDKVGMVEFYGAKRWAVPIQPASNSIEIERALNRLDAGGGTVILPAIEEAYYGLKNVRTRYKHVLILTDGGVETGAFEPLLRRMADDGMTVSTVLIGPDAHSEFLVNIANWGQGRFYSVPNRFNLPEILLKQPASAKLPAYRPGVAPVRASGGPSWWGDVDVASVPPLDGYVETRLRPGAEIVLETERDGHPVLASWRYGLGRVTAMTTEPAGPGTSSWQDWDGYGEMLARVLARTAADSADPFAFELVREPGGAVLVAERRSGVWPCVPSARFSVGGAEPEWVDAEFVSLAPDRYEARVTLDPSQSLRVRAQATEARELVGRPRLFSLDALAGGAREFQVGPGVRALVLASVLETGGTSRSLEDVTTNGLLEPPVRSAAAGAAEARSSAGTTSRLVDHAPWLALLALLLYLMDVTYRRWPKRGPL